MMKRRDLIAAGAAVIATTLAACHKPAEPAAPVDEAPPPAPPAPPPPPPPEPDTVTVSLQTDKGEIVLLLEAKKAPITVGNFLKYVDAGKLVGAPFWRAAHSGESGFIQATMKGPTFPPIAHESTKVTGLSHTSGAISMSRFAPGTATADFVICVGDNTYMDFGRNGSDDHLGYAAFGHVVKGMGVVRSILAGRIDSHTREGGWSGQMLKKPVIIQSATRVAPAQVAVEAASAVASS